MPMVRSRYPSDWDAISKARRESAGQRCEWCKVPNGAEVTRAPGGFWALSADAWHDKTGNPVDVRDVCGSIEYAPESHVLPACKLWRAKIVLTVAHLGVDKPDGTTGDPHDKSDVRPENLAALCQSCHLNYDRAEHERTRRRNIRRKKARVQPALGLWSSNADHL